MVDNKARTTGSSSPEQITAAKFSASSDVTARGSHLQEISHLNADRKAKVD